MNSELAYIDRFVALRIPKPLWRRMWSDVRYLQTAELRRSQIVETVVYYPDGSKGYSLFPVWMLPRNRPAKRQKPMKYWPR
jgi:hypothetical protein